MTTTTQTILSVAALLVATGYFIYHLKQFLITHTATVTRETDTGERLSISVNFVEGDEYNEMNKKVKELFDLCDDRKKFTWDRFQSVIKEEEEKQRKEAELAANVTELRKQS